MRSTSACTSARCKVPPAFDCTGRQLLVLDLLVSLEGDAPEQRSLGHLDDDPIAAVLDLGLLEQIGRQQFLQAGIERGVVELAAPGFEGRADGGGIDAAVAFDRDRGGRLRAGFNR